MDGTKFCKMCGAPAEYDEEVEDFEPSSSPFEHDKKKALVGIWGLILPVVLVLIGVAVYGFFKSAGSEGFSDSSEVSLNESYLPNILSCYTDDDGTEMCNSMKMKINDNTITI